MGDLFGDTRGLDCSSYVAQIDPRIPLKGLWVHMKGPFCASKLESQIFLNPKLDRPLRASRQQQGPLAIFFREGFRI